MKINDILNKFDKWGLEYSNEAEKEALIKFFKRRINRTDLKYLTGSLNPGANNPENAKKALAELRINANKNGNDYPEGLIEILFANLKFQEDMLARLNSDARTTKNQLNKYINELQKQTIHEFLDAMTVSAKMYNDQKEELSNARNTMFDLLGYQNEKYIEQLKEIDELKKEIEELKKAAE